MDSPDCLVILPSIRLLLFSFSVFPLSSSWLRVVD